ncbi:hypothetical protein [Actinoalloteichus spitiensis]|uniref:hypothetical protein n=1 Tax=Actinoalloteichus spitiensis TaxID=252394 RepID=UPI000309C7A0|nr:hypothetical protein [Actinoalloteichus spitiensis]
MATTRTGRGRARGSIQQHDGSSPVRTFPGVDPVTGKDRYPPPRPVRGAGRAAQQGADQVLTRLLLPVETDTEMLEVHTSFGTSERAGRKKTAKAHQTADWHSIQ